MLPMAFPDPFTHALFTYGSLMCADIMAAVVGDQLRCTPAILSGYRRFLVRDEYYPGVIPDAQAAPWRATCITTLPARAGRDLIALKGRCMTAVRCPCATRAVTRRWFSVMFSGQNFITG